MDKQNKKLTGTEVRKLLIEIIHLFHTSCEIQKELKEKNKSSLEELINYLRVSIKYMLFDIESLKRENKQLKKLLENKEN